MTPITRVPMHSPSPIPHSAIVAGIGRGYSWNARTSPSSSSAMATANGASFMFMNPKDAPFAVAMALLLLGLVRAFQEYPRPMPATIALCGIGLGLCIGTRVIGVIAGAYGLAALVLLYTAERRVSGSRTATRYVGQFLLALLPGLVLA